MEKGIDPIGPDNILVLKTSVLTGAPLPGANRLTIAAKSPLSEGFGEAEAGGFISFLPGFEWIIALYSFFLYH